MVEPRPLKLKRELARGVAKPVADQLPIARIWVDTGVFHLDETFDYLVPEPLSEVAQVGVRVEVEFGSSMLEGMILERVDETETSTKLKAIVKVLSPHPISTTETIDLIRAVCRRWAGSPYDVIRSAIPPRVASVDRESCEKLNGSPEIIQEASVDSKVPGIFSKQSIRCFWSPPAASQMEEFVDIVIARLRFGQVLIVCTDERELLEIERHLSVRIPVSTIARLDAHSARSDRYRNFLRVAKGSAMVGLGLRGAIFTPLAQGSTIIVLGESSDLLYEPRTPGWNARDVAILRTSTFGVNLILVGHSASLETTRLIDRQWLSLINTKSRREVIAQSQDQGALLSSKAFAVVRKGLSVGPVLFLVPRKGYGNAVLCSKCRNIAHCDCGGRLQINSPREKPTCAICTRIYDEWRCSFCQSADVYLAARGLERFSEEIGRAFPHFKVIHSSGEHIIDAVGVEPALVIATPNAEPRASAGFSAVILLEGNRFFGSSDVRAGERSREQFFHAASLVSTSGQIFVAIDPSHPIVAALTRWDSTPMMRRELLQHEETHLPPYFRFVIIEVETKQCGQIHSGLEEAMRAGRIPSTTIIRGPHERENSISRITLSAPIADAPQLIDFIHELQKRRSLSHKTLLKLRVDPYSLL